MSCYLLAQGDEVKIMEQQTIDMTSLLNDLRGIVIIDKTGYERI